MKNRIDDFIETLTEDEVSQLMYRISMRVLIPQYFTKEDIHDMIEECSDSDSDLTDSIFNYLIDYFRGGSVLEENIFSVIEEYLNNEE